MRAVYIVFCFGIGVLPLQAEEGKFEAVSLVGVAEAEKDNIQKGAIDICYKSPVSVERAIELASDVNYRLFGTMYPYYADPDFITIEKTIQGFWEYLMFQTLYASFGFRADPGCVGGGAVDRVVDDFGEVVAVVLLDQENG